MKQKQTKAAAANGAKANKKLAPPKKVQEPVEENEEEEQEIVVKKTVNNKGAKNQKQVVPKKAANKKAAKVQVVEEEPEEEEEQEDPEEMEQDEQEEDDEEKDADEEDDQDEENDGDEDEMDAEEEGDEEPTIPSQVKSGQIAKHVESSKIIHITKLPKKCDQTDIVEVFAKYGAIEHTHIVVTPGGSVANVVFKTEKAAKAALAANKTVRIGNSLINVTLKKEKPKKGRSHQVYIRNISVDTTDEQLREHFAACGEIEHIRIETRSTTGYAFITFTESSAVESALKLHNSILNGVNIIVVRNVRIAKWSDRYDLKRTIKMSNKQQFKNIETKKIESIFSKCGKIDLMDIMCDNIILALVQFETEEEAQKALKLNGKTIQDVELELELYNPNLKNAIFVNKLPRGCTNEDLENCFSKAAEIASIYRPNPGCAVIRYKTTDGYCKSFLLNESLIKGQHVFIEPYSLRKQELTRKLKNKYPYPGKGFKRQGGKQNGYDSVFTPKRSKTK